MLEIYPYIPKPGRQVTGFVALDSAAKNNEVGAVIKAIHPITAPVLLAVGWVIQRSPRAFGAEDFVKEDGSIDYDLMTGLMGATIPRLPLYGKEKLVLMDSHGNFSDRLRDNYNRLVALNYVQWLPVEPAKAYSIEAILLSAHMHWQAYAALYDAVKQNEFSKYGGIKSWIFEELIMLGLGYPKVTQTNHAKRAPKVVEPTGWGIRLVELAEADPHNRFLVTQEMRDGARYRPIAKKTAIPRFSLFDKLVKEQD